MKSNNLYFRGRVGLAKILSGLGISHGDRVLIQAFTCVAVPEAIMSIGASPVYVDIENNSVNMDPKKIEDCLISHAKIKAIIVQHTFGIIANMDVITKISKSYNVELIEDCCHSFGSSINGEKAGSWGVASFNSFEWGKPIIAGIGGSVETSNEELESYLRKNYNTLSNPGLLLNIRNTLQMVAFFLLYRPSLYWPIKDMFHFFSKIGLITGNYSYDKNISINNYEYSMKMPFINKVFLSYSNSKINKTLEHRKKIGELYYNLLKDIDSISIPFIPTNQEVYYCRFPILVKDKLILLKHARAKHFEISSWYESPVHPLTRDQLIDVGYINGSCQNVEKLCDSVVSLPVNNRVTEENVRQLSDFLHAEYK